MTNESSVILNKQHDSESIRKHPEIAASTFEATKESKSIQLEVEPLVGKLQMKDETAPLIEVLYSDGKWVGEEAVIQAHTVEVPLSNRSKEVTGIRYAWQDDPKRLLLDSETGWPVLPYEKEW